MLHICHMQETTNECRLLCCDLLLVLPAPQLQKQTLDLQHCMHIQRTPLALRLVLCIWARSVRLQPACRHRVLNGAMKICALPASPASQ